MQKKHSFSPNHKVVTDSKHNHHPFGAPTTASQGQPPAQMGAGGDGTQAPQDGGGEGGGMDGMNFCNGGMKYDDGGTVTPQSGPDAQKTSGIDTGRGSYTPQTGPDAGTKKWKGAPSGEVATGVPANTPSGTHKTPMEIADEES